jgi:hypothetical protein
MKVLLAALRRGEPLPQQVWIPAEFDQTFDALWKRSIITPIREWGVTIVKTAGGVLVLGVEIKGKENGKSISFPSSALSQTGFVGTVHTHPYADGTTVVPFSEGDFTNVINSRQEIAIVQSGETRFLLAQWLSDWRGPVNPADVERELYESWADFLSDPCLDWRAALLQANVVLCRRYGLGLYQGSGRTLTLLEGGGLHE